jgi:uncharacterized protein YjbI with pentapeptide repeats
MVRPQRATVVPRALSPISGDPLPLEELLEPYLGGTGAIALEGPFGSGKTTALGHLRAVLPGRFLALDEEATARDVRTAAEGRLTIHANDGSTRGIRYMARLRLAPWGRDEALEYLMAVHPARCGEVMKRLADDDETDTIGGSAEVWCAVLDRLADGKPHVAAALAAIATRARESDRILKHAPVRTMRAALEVAQDVREERECALLRDPLPPDVLRTAARLLRGQDRPRGFLDALCAGADDRRQPAAASLLLALDPDWKVRGVPRLTGARLRGARWPAVVLPGVRLERADLARATLDAAILAGAEATRASFRDAALRGAVLEGARLRAADLRGADLAGARLKGADLHRAILRGAALPGADLAGACLLGAHVEGADLSGANLSGARANRLDLRRARLDGARFSAALLDHCHLEGVDLPRARFDHADLRGAVLTGCRMPDACFRDASLTAAKLADVTLERADLRGADLRGAIFHMGSSRGGLVDSVIASEGTRTGFYTDEYEEQHFKAPEEIRKANLVGADLRGARVEDADFYLVDLRGALYDDEQGRHFRRCGAILVAKRP